ncbi:hypothetical protein CAOG_010136 [Capsaspora owczarzaki ATCC 30864]|nr:hypothetical protein CAOG_010136 [Capsaspora owczarzaki ATCC 30864]
MSRASVQSSANRAGGIPGLHDPPSRPGLPVGPRHHVAGGGGPPESARAQGAGAGANDPASASTALVPVSRPLINPFNGMDSLPRLSTSRRRWTHIFPSSFSDANEPHSPNWRSLCSPGCLPITTDFFPTESDLVNLYHTYAYSMSLETDEAADSIYDNNSEAMMRELISQRLAQGFQLIVFPKKDTASKTESAASSTTPSRTNSVVANLATMGTDGTNAAAAAATPEPSQPAAQPPLKSAQQHQQQQQAQAGLGDSVIGTTATSITNPDLSPSKFYLSMGHHYHRLLYDPRAKIMELKRYSRSTKIMKPIAYSYRLRFTSSLEELPMTADFIPQVADFNWNYLDQLICGHQSDFMSSLKYWRARFVLLPLPARKSSAASSSLSSSTVSTQQPGGVAAAVASTTASRPILSQLDLDREQPEEVAQRVAGFTKFVESLNRVRQKTQTHFQEDDVNVDIDARSPSAAAARNIGGRKLQQSASSSMLSGTATPSTASSPSAVAAPSSSSNQERFDVAIKLNTRPAVSGEAPPGGGGGATGAASNASDVASAVPSAVGNLASNTASPRSSTPSRQLSSLGLLDRERLRFPRLGRDASSSASAGQALEDDPLLSKKIRIDIDPTRRSDRKEWVVVQHDAAYNPLTSFHIELHWLVSTGVLVNELIQMWARKATAVGFSLVPAPVEQLRVSKPYDPFRAPSFIPLAYRPLKVQSNGSSSTTPTGQNDVASLAEIGMGDLAGAAAAAALGLDFDVCLMAHFDFLLDIESDRSKRERVGLAFTASPDTPTLFTQFIHRSGVAFLQVLDEDAAAKAGATNEAAATATSPGAVPSNATPLGRPQGFYFLNNHLLSLKWRGANSDPLLGAKLFAEMTEFCASSAGVKTWWDTLVQHEQNKRRAETAARNVPLQQQASQQTSSQPQPSLSAPGSGQQLLQPNSQQQLLQTQQSDTAPQTRYPSVKELEQQFAQRSSIDLAGEAAGECSVPDSTVPPMSAVKPLVDSPLASPLDMSVAAPAAPVARVGRFSVRSDSSTSATSMSAAAVSSQAMESDDTSMLNVDQDEDELDRPRVTTA